MSETEEKNTDELPANTDAKESYHILTFAKEHPASFVAILSSVVAAAAFIMNLLTFIYQQLRLQPWHISGQFISDGGSRQIFLEYALMLAYCFLIYGIPIVLSRSFVHYFRLRAALAYHRARHKLIKQQYRSLRRKGKDLKSVLNEQGQKKLKDIETSVKDIRKEVRKAQRSSFLASGLLVAWMIVICLLASTLFFPIAVLIFGVVGELDWKGILITWGISTPSIVLLAWHEAKTLDIDHSPATVRSNKKRMIKLEDAPQQLSSKSAEALEMAKKHIKLQSLLSDRALKETGEKMLLGTMMALMIFLSQVAGNAYKQKEFWMYSDSENLYAVAYQDTYHCVLKRATVDGDTIVIHTGEQLVINGTVSTYLQDFEYVSFEDEPD